MLPGSVPWRFITSSASEMLFGGLLRGDRRRVSRTPEPKDGRKLNRRANSVGAEGGAAPQKSVEDVCAVQSSQWGDRPAGSVSRGDSMSTCASSRFNSGTFPAEIPDAAAASPAVCLFEGSQGEFCGEDESERIVDVTPDGTPPMASAAVTPRLISSCAKSHLDLGSNTTGKDSGGTQPVDEPGLLDAVGRSSRKRSSGAFIQPLSGDSAEACLSSSAATDGVEDSRSNRECNNTRTKATQQRTALLLPIPCRRFGAPPPQPPSFSVHQHSRHRSLPTGSCRSRPIVKHVSFHSPLVVQASCVPSQREPPTDSSVSSVWRRQCAASHLRGWCAVGV